MDRPQRDHKYQAGEEGNQTANALSGAVSVNPDLKQPITNEWGLFFEQQLTEVLGTRVGYVYKDESDLIGQINPRAAR